MCFGTVDLEISGSRCQPRDKCHLLIIVHRATKLEIAAMLYTPETLAALGRYQSHLQDVKLKLDDRRDLARKELSRYGDVEESELSDAVGSDGGTLVEIARRYGSLLREVDMVKMEIARIGE